MGIYIYAVAKSSSRTLLVEGRAATSAAPRYVCRASDLDVRFDREQRRAANLIQGRFTRMEQAWGDDTPAYAVRTGADGKYSEDDLVLSWPKGRVVCDDCDYGGAEFVGRLRRQGRHWIVVPLTSN